MKPAKILTVIIFIFLAVSVYGQTNERVNNWQREILKDKNLSKKDYKNSFIKYDFGSLWTDTENSVVFGFIGENYQRLRIKIISAVKNKKNHEIYIVSGKSMIKNNVCAFNGTIKIINAKFYKRMHFGVDDEYKNKGIKRQGILIGEYSFLETGCIFSGRFEGRLATKFYIDKIGKLKYDDVEKASDGYRNNQFIGTWKSYRGSIVKNANWGDYRIAVSGDLDIGAGEFSPGEKYLNFGWRNYREAYLNNDQQAGMEEQREWWK